MPEVAFTVDQSKSMTEQAVPGHNRWHPDVPPAASVKPGSDFRVECREWTDAQIGNNDSANDVRDVDLSPAHMLSGPVAIEGAEPGDLLAVEILDLGPVPAPQEYGDAPGQGWGYTGIFAKVNGGGFLTDHFPDAYKAIWDFRGQEATSRHIPGRPLHGHHPSGAVRDRAVGGSAGGVEPARAGADRHRSRPRAGAGPAAAGGPRAGRHAVRQRAGQGGARGRAHGARAGERRQPRHQELHAWKQGLLPRARGRRQPVGRRSPLLPGRRRDHVLRRDRDGRVHRLRGRPDQGRDEQVQRPHQPGVHPGPGGAALRRSSSRSSGSRSTRRAPTTTSTPRSPTGGRA